MSWLVRMQLDRQTLARCHFRDSYAWHQAVWECFPGMPDAGRDFLTRMDCCAVENQSVRTGVRQKPGLSKTSYRLFYSMRGTRLISWPIPLARWRPSLTMGSVPVTESVWPCWMRIPAWPGCGTRPDSTASAWTGLWPWTKLGPISFGAVPTQGHILESVSGVDSKSRIGSVSSMPFITVSALPRPSASVCSCCNLFIEFFPKENMSCATSNFIYSSLSR